MRKVRGTQLYSPYEYLGGLSEVKHCNKEVLLSIVGNVNFMLIPQCVYSLIIFPLNNLNYGKQVT
jgi:hypothetical protein